MNAKCFVFVAVLVGCLVSGLFVIVNWLWAVEFGNCVIIGVCVAFAACLIFNSLEPVDDLFSVVFVNMLWAVKPLGWNNYLIFDGLELVKID